MQQQGAQEEPPQDYYYYGGEEQPQATHSSSFGGWSPSLALHQPVYSQHHANLDGAVDSSRWTAMYGDGQSYNSSNDAAASNAGTRVQQALRNSQGATVGDMLDYVPPLQQSPPVGQHRALYDDNEVSCGVSEGANGRERFAGRAVVLTYSMLCVCFSQRLESPVGMPTKPFIAKLVHLVDNPAE